MFLFFQHLTFGNRLLLCFEIEECCVPEYKRYVVVVCSLFVFVYGCCRNNKILERHLSKVYEVIEGSMTMLEDEERAIHSAALPCVTQFPWSVSLRYLKKIIYTIKRKTPK